MIPEKRVIRRIQSGGYAIHCQDCSISQLCIPFTLNEHELDQLDNIIERKNLFKKDRRCLKQVMNLNHCMLSVLGPLKATPLPKKAMNKLPVSIWRVI
ncbi:conserved domain protein [Yersinia pestis KIM D27]|nr:conserved domain protein [Yersinia pestis KIM D27]